MRFSVVIASWNARAALDDCLESIRSQRLDGELETIVVDNASTDGTHALARKHADGIRWVRNERNIGYSKGINQGARLARGELLFLLNSDTTLARDHALQRLADALADPRVGLAAPRYLFPDGAAQPGCARHPSVSGALLQAAGLHHALPDRLLARVSPSHWSHDHSRTTGWIMGAVLALRRSVFEDVGGLWPLMYASEQDLAWRIQERGLTVRYVRESEVIHVVNFSNRQRWSDSERAARIAEGELTFLATHYRPAHALAIRLVTGAGYASRAVAFRALGQRSRAAVYAASAREYARAGRTPIGSPEPCPDSKRPRGS